MGHVVGLRADAVADLVPPPPLDDGGAGGMYGMRPPRAPQQPRLGWRNDHRRLSALPTEFYALHGERDDRNDRLSMVNGRLSTEKRGSGVPNRSPSFIAGTPCCLNIPESSSNGFD